MDDLYREQIIERYKNPHYRGELDPHDFSYEDDNPLCGDKIRIDVRINADDVVTEAAFSGQGCSISQASADLLVETIIGKSLEEVKAMSKDDILALLGIELGPVRLKCALLSLKVVKAGVYGLAAGEAADFPIGVPEPCSVMEPLMRAPPARTEHPMSVLGAVNVTGLLPKSAVIQSVS